MNSAQPHAGAHPAAPTLQRYLRTTLLLALHLALIQRQGISVPPAIEAEWKADPAARREMHFFPNFFLRELIAWYVALGVLVFKERLRPGQWAAIAIAAAGVAHLTISSGAPPWIALALVFLGWWLARPLLMTRYRALAEGHEDKLVTRRDRVFSAVMMVASVMLVFGGATWAEQKYPRTIPLQIGRAHV